VLQHAAALIVAQGGMKLTSRMPFLYQKTDTMIFFTEIEVLNFLVLYGAIAVTVVWIQECGEKPMFHLVTMESKNSSPSCV
jgi:hypothetical protein